MKKKPLILTPAMIAEALRVRQSELGQRRSERKAAASRANGALGGRPRKVGVASTD